MTFSMFLEIAGMLFISIIAVLIPLYIGQYYGQSYNKQSAHNSHDSIGSVVSAVFGLLAFMLAFTFQIAANRYDARKTSLLTEVKDTRTTYLRAGLIPEPYRSQSKKYLVEYVNLRVEIVKDYSRVDIAMSKSQQILDSLWKYAEDLAAVDRSSEAYALYTTSINDMVDAYNERVTMVLVYRIPSVVMWVLAINMFLSMLVLGYQFGVSGKSNFKINLVLAFLFSLVILLIFVLDRPDRGFVQINQTPLLTLQKEMQNKQLQENRAIVP